MKSVTLIAIISILSVLTPLISKLLDYFVEKNKAQNEIQKFKLENQADTYKHDLKYAQDIFEEYVRTTVEFLNDLTNDDLRNQQQKAESRALLYANEDACKNMLGLSMIFYAEKRDGVLLEMLSNNAIPALNKQISSNPIEQ